MLAACNGHKNVVETLLQHVACVDMQNEVSGCHIDSVFRNGTNVHVPMDYMCVGRVFYISR